MIKESIAWDAMFYEGFPGYASIVPLWEPVARNFAHGWPSPTDFNRLASAVQVEPLEFVLQRSHMNYEQLVYLERQVPMRLNLWHDFFNNLTWLTFPHIKSAITKRYFQEGLSNQATPVIPPNKAAASRTHRQNLLAHFDECGMVFCSVKPQPFERVKAFQWRELFWETPHITEYCAPFIIGHGLFEKCLAPYIGLTGKMLFLPVTEDFFELDKREQLKFIDQEISAFILSDRFPDSPRALHPFPLLGWPGWYPANRSAAFYDNTQYFRAKPEKMLVTV